MGLGWHEVVLVLLLAFALLLVSGRAIAQEPKKVGAAIAVASDTLPLWPGEPPSSSSEDSFRPSLTRYMLVTDSPRGAVIVLPGGGYGGRADHEGEPIARRFNDAGYHAFVVNYRVSPHRHPAPLLDATRAIRMVRAHATEWRVKRDKIAILGFSAGGHLAGSTGVFFDAGDASAKDPIARVSSRPDALVLCYPVISSAKFGHKGSFDNLLGAGASEAEREKMSLEKHVRADTPPAFLWSTADDEAVPVENSLAFVAALREKGIRFELHVYPHGPHGLGLAPDDAHIATWPGLCAEWLQGMGW